MTDIAVCGWNTGTAFTGPSRCGKPAKSRTDHPGTNNHLVCGTHARAAGNRNRWPISVTYTVEPIGDQP